METTRLPSIFIKTPEEIFAKFKTPIFIVILVCCAALRAYQFGMGRGKGFDFVLALVGFLIIEVVILGSFFITGGKKLSGLVRFTVLYLGFVNSVSILYLERIKKFSVLFDVRDDWAKHKFKNVFALWYPRTSTLLLLLVPFVILLIMSIAITEGELKKSSVKRWHIISLIICFVLSLLSLPFANTMLICMYIIQVIFVCVIWSLWESVRKYRTVEPLVMVSWAEIALFTAIFLKGVVDVLGTK